jgi:hypothetical protein
MRLGSLGALVVASLLVGPLNDANGQVDRPTPSQEAVEPDPAFLPPLPRGASRGPL